MVVVIILFKILGPMVSFESAVLQVVWVGLCIHIQVYTDPEVRRMLGQPSQIPSCMFL